jgi:hypothetical protein
VADPVDADVVVLCPLLHRVDRFPTMLASLRATTDGAAVLLLVSPGDTAVAGAVAPVLDERTAVMQVPYQPVGDFARKINAGARARAEPLLFLGADDLRFHPGWLQAVRTTLAANPGAKVIGTQDLGNPRVLAGDHATHSMVVRDYLSRGTIDEPGKLLHENYVHEFVDDELVGTAKARGVWAFAAAAIVEHEHSNWGKSPTNSLYLDQGRRMRASRPLYRRRAALWT